MNQNKCKITEIHQKSINVSTFSKDLLFFLLLSEAKYDFPKFQTTYNVQNAVFLRIDIKSDMARLCLVMWHHHK